MKYSITILCTALCLTISTITYSQEERSEKKSEEFSNKPFPEPVDDLLHQPMPAFQLKTIDGHDISLSQFKGKRILMNFWFTNCQPCIEEMPVLNELKDEMIEEDVVFLAITFDSQDFVSHFLELFEFEYTHITDAKEYINQVGIKFYPKTLILDEDHIVRHIGSRIPKGASAQDIEGWKEGLKSLLID